MAGVYIHIPYCKQACLYCNFHFSTSLRGKNDFVTALLKEVRMQKKYLDNDPVETIYLGGGTPSLLSENQVEVILGEIRHNFQVTEAPEITLEANPDDISPEKAESWQRAGINRLSIGIQSFSDEDLRWMHRAHDAGQAHDSIRIAQSLGLGMSVDFIYGTPTLSDAQWRKNIEWAIFYRIPHLSCYALTVEPRTALSKMIQNRKLTPVESEDQARQFQLLMAWLAEAGFEHYEISNFAMPGFRSRHNTAYWQGKKYLGLGPSAHSYDGHSRQWNVANNTRYIRELEKGVLLFEKEDLIPVQVLNEYIMTSLRTIEGLDLGFVAGRFGTEISNRLEVNSGKYIRRRQMARQLEKLVLTGEGKLFADGIAADLFFEHL
jgi:oxygen-independent coproporphyrinogen-3 oxidase